MRQDDWQPMETAPLNPYGKPWGPRVLIWDKAGEGPVSAYFNPWFHWQTRDCGPAWVVADGVGDNAIGPEDASAWMPIVAPWQCAEEPVEATP